MQPVKSSNIVSIGYDPLARTMRVKFKGDQPPYQFDNVDPETHANLMAAQSVGSHFHDKIKGRFPARKLKPEELGPITL